MTLFAGRHLDEGVYRLDWYTRHASGKLEISEIRFAGSRLTISLKDATLASAGRP